MAMIQQARFSAAREDEQAPSTPKKSAEVDSDEQPGMLPRLLMLASPARVRTSPASSPVKDVEVEQSPPSKTASTLNPDAPVFVPSALADIIATASRLRASPAKESVKKDVKGLPPVVSVRKMAAKGCAIVILRDQHVVDLAARMAVAVVDGVCVEVRRHTRRSKHDDEDEEAPSGVFVAWGHRVERRASVSEEGLEAYFNGLSKVATPEGLDPEPPFSEALQLFELSSQGPLSLQRAQKDAANAEQMLNGPHGRPELVRSLWDAKAKLDDIWNKPPPPMGRSLMQRVARDQLFPHSGKEGKEHENRAGEKLEELANAVGLLEGVPVGSAFLDLCGGPGAWSQYLLAKKDLALRGFGFTLRSGAGGEEDWQAEEKDDWYPELLEDPKWTALWGSDGTGDLLKSQNLEHSTRELRKKGGVFLCIADGGFSDKAIPPNQLELYFYRLFLAELLTAASCLVPEGRFVCKLYTACSAATAALLFLTARLFKDVSIVKPMTSRVAGPERYLYASGFRTGPETEKIRVALTQSQVLGAGASPLQLPLLTPLVAPADLAKDTTFSRQLQTMVAILCERQAGSLRAILERAEQLEDIALEAAADARDGAKFWAAAAAEQREAREAAEAAKERDEPRNDRFGRPHRRAPGEKSFSGQRGERPRFSRAGNKSSNGYRTFQ